MVQSNQTGKEIEVKYIPYSIYMDLREAAFVDDLHRCEIILGLALKSIFLFEKHIEVTTLSGKKIAIFPGG